MNTLYEVLGPLREIADHLDRHDLPTPAGVTVNVCGRTLMVQLHQVGLHGVSAALLAWARTLTE
jgi:hypothetical protein